MYLKYIISLFLIFGIAINDVYTPNQTISNNYEQVSFLTITNKRSSLYIYKCGIYFEQEQPIPFATFLQVEDKYDSQVSIQFKLQNNLFEKINLSNANHIFLNEIITSNNLYSNLYIV